MNVKKIDDKNIEVKLEDWELKIYNIKKEKLFSHSEDDVDYVKDMFTPVINEIMEEYKDEFPEFFNNPIEISICVNNYGNVLIKLRSMNSLMEMGNPIPLMGNKQNTQGLFDVPVLNELFKRLSEKFASEGNYNNNENEEFKEILIKLNSISEAEDISKYFINLDINQSSLLKNDNTLFLYIKFEDVFKDYNDYISEFVINNIITDNLKLSFILEHADYIIKDNAIKVLFEI